MSDPVPNREGRTQHRIDLVATVLLALATVATAWAGYQSSRWHSEQAKAANKGDGEPHRGRASAGHR